MEPRPRLVLASQSPRRRELLGQLGLELAVKPARVDESVLPGEDAQTYVRRVSESKARAIGARRGEYVLAADTTVVRDGTALGKPTDPEDAATMLRSLSGRAHQVLTAVFVLAGPHGQRGPSEAGIVVASEVTFAPLTDAQVAWYVSTGEPLDKAGGYAVQGIAGAFVQSISGSVSNVVGLPLSETLALLGELGFPLPWEAL
jgi:septum formation protein